MNVRMYNTGSWFVMVMAITALIVAIFALLFSCGCTEPIYFDIVDGGDDAGDEMIYPTENLGYKAAVRKIDDKLMLDNGNVLPNFCLPLAGNVDTCMDHYYEMEHAKILVINFGVKDCPPCDEVYESFHDLADHMSEAGYSSQLISIIGDADEKYAKQISDEHWIPVFYDTKKKVISDWENDTWPEQYRGFPSLVFVDTNTMTIMADTLGFENSPEYFEQQLGKINLWNSR